MVGIGVRVAPEGTELNNVIALVLVWMLTYLLLAVAVALVAILVMAGQ